MASIVEIMELQDIRQEIRHLTRRQWRVAVYVILFIVGSSAMCRQIHINALAARAEERSHAVDSR
jgi:hypothetical protein